VTAADAEMLGRSDADQSLFKMMMVLAIEGNSMQKSQFIAIDLPGLIGLSGISRAGGSLFNRHWQRYYADRWLGNWLEYPLTSCP